MSKGIYNRGYLAHWDFDCSFQAITFRLADSVPSSVIRDWKAQLANNSCPQEAQMELHRRIARYEDMGHGASVLMRPECAEAIQSELLEGHCSRYRLLEWCIMPNHIHVMCRLDTNHGLSEIVRKWKGRSALRINRLINRTGTLWQREFYDRCIRDADHYQACRSYIRDNPVRAKLCTQASEWPWSSAGYGWNSALPDDGQHFKDSMSS